MTERASLRALKERVDITEVLRKIGARLQDTERWDDEVKVWCPFCDDAVSHKPAASANVMEGLYYCYKCAFGGSVIDVVIKHLEQSAPTTAAEGGIWGKYTPSVADAVAWLEERWPDPKAEDDPWSS